MGNILRQLYGFGKKPSLPETPVPAIVRDQQSADVAIAAQRVNERTEQVRATIAELLKRNDGKRPSLEGF